MVDDLVRHRNFFWCRHCDKGLFFPISCIEHANTVVGVADVDDEVEEDIVL